MKNFVLVVLVTVLAGCASFQSAVPEGYSGPTATITDTYANHEVSKAHFYALTKVGDIRVEDSGYKTRVDNTGRGFNMTPYMVSREVTNEEQVFTIMGFVQFATDAQGMFGDHMLVTKEVLLKPDTNEKYIVSGKLSKEKSDVWIEDSMGNQYQGKPVD